MACLFVWNCLKEKENLVLAKPKQGDSKIIVNRFYGRVDRYSSSLLLSTLVNPALLLPTSKLRILEQLNCSFYKPNSLTAQRQSNSLLVNTSDCKMLAKIYLFFLRVDFYRWRSKAVSNNSPTLTRVLGAGHKSLFMRDGPFKLISPFSLRYITNIEVRSYYKDWYNWDKILKIKFLAKRFYINNKKQIIGDNNQKETRLYFIAFRDFNYSVKDLLKAIDNFSLCYFIADWLRV